MKLKIYNDPKQATPTEPEVTLRFVTEGDNVYVAAVNNVGNVVQGGYLLKFKKDGTLVIVPSVSSSLGFKLDDKQSIKLSSY